MKSMFKKIEKERRWGNHLLIMLFAFGSYTQVQNPAYAQPSSEDNKPKISLELNKLGTVDNACELTFLVRNEMPDDVEKLALEFAFLDGKGQLSKLATLNFGALKTGRPKITQFGLAETSCENISQIFINSASECTGILPDDCIGTIITTNKTSVQF